MSHIQPDTTKRPPQIKGIYKALISQAGTDAPTVVIIKNTLPTTGQPVWTRQTTGVYRLTSGTSEYFPTGLVTCNISMNRDPVINSLSIIHATQEYVTVISAINATEAIGGTYGDSILAFTPIEILIWDRLQD